MKQLKDYQHMTVIDFYHPVWLAAVWSFLIYQIKYATCYD